MYNPIIYFWKQCAPCYHMVAVQRQHRAESSLSTYIIVLAALLEAERDGVAAMNEVILILRLEIMQLAAPSEMVSRLDLAVLDSAAAR